jgi:hypothetical protein
VDLRLANLAIFRDFELMHRWSIMADSRGKPPTLKSEDEVAGKWIWALRAVLGPGVDCFTT